jgi:hypothetical protein
MLKGKGRMNDAPDHRQEAANANFIIEREEGSSLKQGSTCHRTHPCQRGRFAPVEEAVIVPAPKPKAWLRCKRNLRFELEIKRLPRKWQKTKCRY